MKKVLISGVSGQTGSYLVDYLLELGTYEVFGIVRRSAKQDLSNLTEALRSPNFHLRTADLTDSVSIDTVVREVNPDYFVNLAAQSFVGASWKIPEYTFDVDACGVIRCLEAIRKHVPDCRFYNAGTSEQFGDVLYSPQDEKHPFRARSIYGAAKIAAYQIVKTYRESYGLYAVQGILFNHESPRRGNEFLTRKVTLGVSRILKEIKEGKEVTPLVVGNMESSRDWSHAKDFVDGIWRMLNQESYNWKNLRAAGGYIGFLKDTPTWSKVISEYVLSSNETHTVREFIEKAFDVAGVKIIDVNPDRIEPVECNNGQQINYTLEDGRAAVVVSREFYRPADVTLLHGDSSLARKELGWQPKISFDELVKEMVENDIKSLT